MGSKREKIKMTPAEVEDYLAKALADFKKGVRIGYGNAIMPEVAAALSEPDIADLAHYLSHLQQKP